MRPIKAFAVGMIPPRNKPTPNRSARKAQIVPASDCGSVNAPAPASEIKSKVVATLALFPPFFHFSGDELQSIALRNLYAQAIYKDWTLWAGSRMYRGDDIYLLDWWPLEFAQDGKMTPNTLTPETTPGLVSLLTTTNRTILNDVIGGSPIVAPPPK